jgi:hypothetical protein
LLPESKIDPERGDPRVRGARCLNDISASSDRSRRLIS